MKMRIEVSQAVLSEALQQVARAVSPHSPLPGHSGVLLQTGGNRLTLSAGSAVMTIRADVPSAERESSAAAPGVRQPSGDECGIVVPARYLLDIVRKLPASPVELEFAEELALTVRAGTGVFRLCGMDAGAFPEMPPIGTAGWRITLPNGLLKSMIRQVAFAAASSETRPLLCGVLCRIDGQSMRLVATDSVRFASRTSPLPHANGGLACAEAVIPGKSLSELAKLLHDDCGETTIAADDRHIRFQTSRFTLTCSLLHGTYPPIDKLVPSRFASECTADTALMLHAVERVTLLAGEGHIVRLRLNEGGTAELVASSAEIGDVREEVRLGGRNGDAIAVSFNGKYMADILRAIDSPNVKLRFSDKLGPIAAEPADASSPSVYLLTPIRTAM